jgi:hypothetical protein
VAERLQVVVVPGGASVLDGGDVVDVGGDCPASGVSAGGFVVEDLLAEGGPAGGVVDLA